MRYAVIFIIFMLGGPNMAYAGESIDPKALARALKEQPLPRSQHAPPLGADGKMDGIRKLMPEPNPYPFAPFDGSLTEFRRGYGLGPNDPIPPELLTLTQPPPPENTDQYWGPNRVQAPGTVPASRPNAPAWGR